MPIDYYYFRKNASIIWQGLFPDPSLPFQTTVEPKDTSGPTIVFFVKRLSSSEVSILMGIAAFGTLSSVLYERLSFSRRVLHRRFHCTGETSSYPSNRNKKGSSHTRITDIARLAIEVFEKERTEQSDCKTAIATV
jgi:hypothetical protein